MSERDYTIYIQDIVDNMHNALRFVEGMRMEDFLQDKKTQYAVVRTLK